MHYLTLIGVRIRWIDQLVELFHGLPYRHDGSGFLVEVEFGALEEVIGDGLVGVLGRVLVNYMLGRGIGLILSELGLVLFGVET